MYLYEFSQNRYLFKIKLLLFLGSISTICICLNLFFNILFIYYPLFQIGQKFNTTSNNIDETLTVVNETALEIQEILPFVLNATLSIKSIVDKICSSYTLCIALGAQDLCGKCLLI